MRAISNTRLFDPASNLDEIGNILFNEEGIIACGKDIPLPQDVTTIDGTGLVTTPGLVDMQVFIGEPGGEYRETLATASQAAAAGGVTTMIMMPDTQPVIDDAALVDYISRRARGTALVNVYPMAGITKGLDGEMMNEFGLLHEAGAVAFTDGSRSVMNARIMQKAMSYAANFNALIMHHAIDTNLVGEGVMNESELAIRLGLSGIPVIAETIMIERDIRLVEATGARYHIAQISSRKSIDIVRQAKDKGLPVTCGVSSNHLMLNQNDVENYRTFAKLMPPLRTEEDRQALIEAIADGTIDVIVSGHNPQGEDAKRRPFGEAEFGSIGVETLLAAGLTLHHEVKVPLTRLIEAMSTTPSRLLGLSAGTLSIGHPADLILIDIDAPWIVDADNLHSRSRNAAIEGRKVQGKVTETIVSGKTVFSNND
ncbi:ATP-dependent helicase DEAD-box protein [Candidatus Micropelagos thuwalensis]|uniref:ATP-dependent helicase DEAD-box protein n=1 Tax=Candidatus Micropelagius thuwalensis TaxID=1397666 RepID=U2XQ48_9PROT|nr:dihydroorotase [Candidatus Micropelagos thuwalensis]ERL47242.1 ATP-dependent helicase DEAD-box protein [Candidatus Micropelagos thuwalensis]